MRSILTTLAAAGLAVIFAGCSGPHSRYGYSTVEKDGRLYVFNYNSSEYQKFVRNGELAKSKTYIGQGPNGMTIVAEPELNVDKFLASK